MSCEPNVPTQDAARSSIWYEKDLNEEHSLNVLYRKIAKTACSRFNCSARLQKAHRFSLYILTFFSLASIASSLLILCNLPLPVASNFLTFAQITFSLTILILSLLLTGAHDSAKHEKMHRSGLELNSLAKRILAYNMEERANSKNYTLILEEYTALLNAYDNHDQIDFDWVKLEKNDEYQLSTWNKCWLCVKYIFTFVPVIAVPILCIAAIIYVYYACK